MSTDAQRNMARVRVIMTMFETEAWRHLYDILENTRNELAAELVTAGTWEQSCYLKGQIAELDRVIRLDEYFANALELYEQENEDNDRTEVHL